MIGINIKLTHKLSREDVTIATNHLFKGHRCFGVVSHSISSDVRLRAERCALSLEMMYIPKYATECIDIQEILCFTLYQ